MSRDPLAVLRDAARGHDHAPMFKAQIVEAIAQVESLAYEARAVLEHVESDSIPRIGGQCTLCHTYRMKLHSALDPFASTQDSESAVATCGAVG